MVTHGIDPEQIPMTMAAHPLMTPAAGVMATSPVIMPAVNERHPYQGQTRLTLHGTQDGWLLEVEGVKSGPGQEGHGSADVGVEHSDTSIGASSVWVTTVETVPSDPEKTCTQHDETEVGRLVLEAVRRVTGTDDHGPDKSGGTRRQVDDISARVVDDTELEEETSCPNGECPDSVGESDPKGNKDHPCEKVHPVQIGSCCDDDGDSAESRPSADAY